jgi:hypothetical protein
MKTPVEKLISASLDVGAMRILTQQDWPFNGKKNAVD